MEGLISTGLPSLVFLYRCFYYHRSRDSVSPEGLPDFQLDTVGGTLQSPARTPPKGRERYREQCQGTGEEGSGSREGGEGEGNKRPHSPTDQAAAKKSREEGHGREEEEEQEEQEQEDEQEQGREPRSSRPLVQVDIHPPGSPGLGIQNRRLFDHVTIRKDPRKANI